MFELTPTHLARLHEVAFPESRAWNEDEMRALLSSPLVFTVGTKHGFAMGRVILDEAELMTIVVHPDQQGRGLGRRLLTAFEVDAQSRGAKLAFLEVAENNGPARALYMSAGWVESGRRSGYYARPAGGAVDAILLNKPLPLGEPSE